MSQRKGLIAAVVGGEQSVAALSRAYGVSRKTVYKWLARYTAEGEAGLAERSRTPQRAPRQTARSVEDLIIQARLQHPAWGGRKLKRWLENRGHRDLPVPSTITEILRRNGLLDEGESARHRAHQRFERPQPNELWQMDFKGEFELERGRCFPLGILDDHSRYLLALTSCGNTRRQTVQTQLEEAFKTYGLPEWLLTDNGPPWGSSGQGRWTQLTVWLLRLNVHVTHSRPRHPQTQGKEERLHRTLKEEVLRRCEGKTLAAWQKHFDAWRQIYNTERPHEALALAVPASRYAASKRSYPAQMPELEYPEGAQMRKVSDTGRIEFKGRTWSMGKAFKREWVGLLENVLTGGCWKVYYGGHMVHEIDFGQP